MAASLPNPRSLAVKLPALLAADSEAARDVWLHLDGLFEQKFWQPFISDDDPLYLICPPGVEEKAAARCKNKRPGTTTALAAGDDFSALALIAESWQRFSLEPYYDKAAALAASGKPAAEQIAEVRDEIHQKSPLLFWYEGLPSFIITAADDSLVKRHISFLAECSFYDNAAAGLLPMIINPALLEKFEQHAPAAGMTLRDYIYKNLAHLECELEFSRPDLSQGRYRFNVETKDDLERHDLILLSLEQASLSAPYELQAFSRVLSESGSGIRNRPHYFEIELSNECELACTFCPRSAVENKRGHMPLELFEKLLSSLAEDAGRPVTLCLGGLGEPLQHPEFSKAVEMLGRYRTGWDKLFIETNGLHLDEAALEALLALEEKGQAERVTLIINLNSLEDEQYRTLYGADRLAEARAGLERAVAAYTKAGRDVRKHVVAQMIKMKETDEHSEAYFEALNETCTVLFQKYNDFTGLLEERRPSDLTPLMRSFCWHLARDMFIRANGDVTFCRQDVTGEAVTRGNLATHGLADLWQSSAADFSNNYAGRLADKPACHNCTEWFTFNA